jgi:oxygen-independent coproporphyrinogen-3 oxidase
LCLHEVPASVEEVAGNVLLAHGMYSNYRACRGLAQYLARMGYHCWLLDSQGHGFSDAAAQPVDFETQCLEDSEAALDFIESQSSQQWWWVGHSGGGLAMAMYLARNPARQALLQGMVTMASQATDAGLHRSRRMTLRIIRLVINVLGVAPGKRLGLGPENESVRVMDQWLRWSLTGRWTGTDSFDYLAGLHNIQLPSLSLAAAADRFIAPASGCLRLHQHLGGTDKTYVLFGKADGYLEDYTHARLVSSRNASVDVWPLVGQWIKERQTR